MSNLCVTDCPNLRTVVLPLSLNLGVNVFPFHNTQIVDFIVPGEISKEDFAKLFTMDIKQLITENSVKPNTDINLLIQINSSIEEFLRDSIDDYDEMSEDMEMTGKVNGINVMYYFYRN